MKIGRSHIVLKSTLIVEKDSSDEREDHQLLLERLSVLGNGFLPDLFNEGFDSVVPENEIWKVDRLELEINLENVTELEESISQQLPHLIKMALRGTSVQSSNTRIDTLSNKLVSTFICILHYLKTGVLPWNSSTNTSTKDLNEVFKKSLIAHPEFVKDLRLLFLSNEKALERFFLHFEKRYLWQFYKEVQKISSKEQPLHFSDWQKQYQKRNEGNKVKEKSYWVRLLGKGTDMKEAEDKMLEAKEKAINEEEVLYLEGAGLILLHPFIVRFLESLQLVREKEVLQPNQAACLLHSLVTGASPAAEWQLALPKILLGLTIDTPLEIRSVSEKEMDSGTEMIQAALAHWSVLGATSVEGFRESFLQRSGRLKTIREGWLLELEQAPYDMLIDQLPWQMSYIQLPWMPASVRMNI